MESEGPDPNTVRNLASGALRLIDASDRAEFLKKNCRDDMVLRQAVEKFVSEMESETIAADGSSSGKPSNRPPSGSSKPAPHLSPTMESVGSIIGPYHLTKILGEGGFGIVYEAEQKEPVQRKVALKVIKPGMDTAEVIARFEAERQALALMDHPNIAKVFDAGTTTFGRPYFVMELVSGEAITDFCDRKKLTARQRLDLFIPVCQAIQHAHQKAVIHRDLKPSNILVSEQDGKPLPTIIDFGIAKALRQELTGRTLHTAAGMVIGTPQYMSPEQAAADPSDIDTQSDVYSLGIVLYELLTGSTPIDLKTLRKAACDQILKLIREVETPKPSTRIRSLGDTDESELVAQQRHSNTARLVKTVRGELDWIVMKAIEKDRDRRYQSVSSFSADIGRYLNNEPVSASPPSAVYRFRKFARRNRGSLSAAAAIAATLLIGTIVSINQAILADRARSQAEAVAGFLVSAFRSPDPGRDGHTITIFEVLDRATSEIDDEFGQDPELRSRLLRAIGQTYSGLGLEREAGDIQRKNLDLLNQLHGSEHIQTLVARQDLGNTLRKIGQYDEAIDLLEDTASRQQRSLGSNDPDTIKAVRDLASAYMFAGRTADGIRLHEESSEKLIALFGAEHPDSIRAITDLGSAWFIEGDFKEALIQYDTALQQSRSVFGPDNVRIAEAVDNVADAYRQLGRTAEAIRMHRESLRIIKKKYGPDHPNTLSSQIGLAMSLSKSAEFDEAIAILENTTAKLRTILGEEDSTTLNCVRNLAIVYHEAGRIEESVEQQRLAYEVSRKFLGADHPETLASMNSLAIVLMEAGKTDESVTLQKEVYEINKKTNGEAHPETLRTMFNLAVIYFDDLDRKEDSMQLQEESLAIHRRAFGNADPRTLVTRSQLARGFGVMGQHDRTIEILEPIFELLVFQNRPDHPEIPQAAISLAVAFRENGRADEAEQMLLDIYQHVNALHLANPKVERPVDPLRVITQLVRHYKATGEQSELDKWRQVLREEREELTAAASSP